MSIQGFDDKGYDRRENIQDQCGTQSDSFIGIGQQTIDNPSGGLDSTVSYFRYILEIEISSGIAITKYLSKSVNQGKKIVDKLTDKQVIKLGKMLFKATNGNPVSRIVLTQALLSTAKTLKDTQFSICENCGAFVNQDSCRCTTCNTYFSTIKISGEENGKKKKRTRAKKSVAE